MKKKYREITVNNKTYAWTLKSDGKEHVISIWENKKVIHNETVRCDITPSLVREIIEKKVN